MKYQPLSVAKIPAGRDIRGTKPGDFFLIHRTKFFSHLIQFGQGIRYSKEEAYWNHCGIFIDENGGIAEALVHHGITKGNISKYTNEEYLVVRIQADDEDRKEMLEFINWADKKPYGMSTDVSLALWCLFGGKFEFGIDGSLICSGFVARTLERAGYIFDRDPQREMPADLAHKFSVHAILNSSLPDSQKSLTSETESVNLGR